MKKKYREITVDDVQYGWTFHYDCDGDGNMCVAIWRDKKIIYREIVKGGYTLLPSILATAIRRIVLNPNIEEVINNTCEIALITETIEQTEERISNRRDYLAKLIRNREELINKQL
jgi:hypothetical protein